MATQTAPALLRFLTCATLLAAVLSGCGSSEDTFEVSYRAPIWSPEGTSIAFVANDDLYVTELGGRTTRHGDLVAENEGLDDPTRSPDGRKIAYDVCEQSEVNPYCWFSHTVVRDLGSGRTFAFNQDGADGAPVTFGPLTESGSPCSRVGLEEPAPT